MAQWSSVIPRGLVQKMKREPDSLALGWQLSPKEEQETDVPLTPSPLSPFPSLAFSSGVHLIIDRGLSEAQLGVPGLLSCCI